MTVSALIPHYGDPEPTLALIEQLHAQEGIEGLEIVVSDDHSPEPFPRGDGYRLVRRSANGGFGSNVNSAASVATGDFLLILNSDLTLAKTFLRDLLDVALPLQPAVVAPRIVEPSGPIHVARRWPKARHHAWEWLTPLARIRHTKLWHRCVGHDVTAYASTSPTRTDWLMGACLLIPRAAFEQVGGFDERFFMNSEEIDLQRRLADAGIPAWYAPSVAVEHEGGGSSAPAHRRGWVTDSRFRYAAKWGGGQLLRFLLVLATEVNFLWNLTRWARRVDGVTPFATRRFEHELIAHGWEHRHDPGKAGT